MKDIEPSKYCSFASVYFGDLRACKLQLVLVLNDYLWLVFEKLL